MPLWNQPYEGGKIVSGECWDSAGYATVRLLQTSSLDMWDTMKPGSSADVPWPYMALHATVITGSLTVQHPQIYGISGTCHHMSGMCNVHAQ